MWEKEKMLVTSIFSFPHIVFYLSCNKLQDLLSANAFKLELSKILSFGKELSHVSLFCCISSFVHVALSALKNHVWFSLALLPTHHHLKIFFSRPSSLPHRAINVLEISIKILSVIYYTIRTFFTTLAETTIIENNVEKGVNAFFFPQCFLIFERLKWYFELHLVGHLQFLSIWISFKFCHFLTGLREILILPKQVWLMPLLYVADW